MLYLNTKNVNCLFNITRELLSENCLRMFLLLLNNACLYYLDFNIILSL